jgi:sulfur transfer complex TusBCD TusB component (DsrH family)
MIDNINVCGCGHSPSEHSGGSSYCLAEGCGCLFYLLGETQMIEKLFVFEESKEERQKKKQLALKTAVRQEVELQMSVKLALERETMQAQINEMKAQYLAMLEQLLKVTTKIKSDIKDYFNNSEFMMPFKQSIFKYITDEMNVKFSQEGVRDIMKDKAYQIVEENFKGIISEVIDRTVNNILKKSERDLEVTKAICYATEMEIKHVVQRNGISVDIEDVFRKSIDEACGKLASSKMIIPEDRQITDGGETNDDENFA